MGSQLLIWVHQCRTRPGQDQLVTSLSLTDEAPLSRRWRLCSKAPRGRRRRVSGMRGSPRSQHRSFPGR